MIVVEHQGRWTRAIEAPMPAGAASRDRTRCCSASPAAIPGHARQPASTSTAPGTSRLCSSPAPETAGPLLPRRRRRATPTRIPTSSPRRSPARATVQCAAVGTYVNPLQNSLGLLLNESGGNWESGTGATLPANAAPPARSATKPSCSHPWRARRPAPARLSAGISTTTRTARGCSSPSPGGVWQPGAEVALPSNAVGGLEKQSAGLDWISCASLGNCVATGVYTDLGYNSQGFCSPR